MGGPNGAFPGAMPPMTPPAAGPPPGSGITTAEVDCAVEALPRLGNLVGSVTNAEGGAGVAQATVVITDSAGKERTMTTDGSGAFRVEGLTPGPYQLRASQEAYLGGAGEVTVRAREDNKITVSMDKRPKRSSIIIGKQEIIIRQQVHFEKDSAAILSDSSVLLEEIADALNKTPRLKLIEIQGHTDNQGAAEYNKRLSDQRANAVRDRLISLGVASSRLQAKGYGAEQPVVPNVTAGNRARNRRVALVIKQQDKAPLAGSARARVAAVGEPAKTGFPGRPSRRFQPAGSPRWPGSGEPRSPRQRLTCASRSRAEQRPSARVRVLAPGACRLTPPSFCAPRRPGLSTGPDGLDGVHASLRSGGLVAAVENRDGSGNGGRFAVLCLLALPGACGLPR